MYWSEVMMFAPMQVATVVAIRLPVLCTKDSAKSTSRCSSPTRSMVAPKTIAHRISQTVLSIELMPPRDIKSSRVALPLCSTKPLNIVSHTPLTRAKNRFGASPGRLRIACRWNSSARTMPNTPPARIVGIGGSLRLAITSRAITGNSITGEMVKFSVSRFMVMARSSALAPESMFRPISA